MPPPTATSPGDAGPPPNRPPCAASGLGNETKPRRARLSAAPSTVVRLHADLGFTRAPSASAGSTAVAQQTLRHRIVGGDAARILRTIGLEALLHVARVGAELIETGSQSLTGVARQACTDLRTARGVDAAVAGGHSRGEGRGATARATARAGERAPAARARAAAGRHAAGAGGCACAAQAPSSVLGALGQTRLGVAIVTQAGIEACGARAAVRRRRAAGGCPAACCGALRSAAIGIAAFAGTRLFAASTARALILPRARGSEIRVVIRAAATTERRDGHHGEAQPSPGCPAHRAQHSATGRGSPPCAPPGRGVSGKKRSCAIQKSALARASACASFTLASSASPSGCTSASRLAAGSSSGADRARASPPLRSAFGVSAR